VRATARADTQSPLWHPEPAKRSCAAGEATQMAFSYRLTSNCPLIPRLSCTLIAQRSNRQDFVFRKPFLDFAHTHAANKHSENLFDNRRGFRVGYKVVAVVRVWDIAVWIFPVDALAF
ncbi:hypothetical protein, partial [Collinsella sp. LCP19S3_A6]|uniref:hypothetical protein n=1 Tax=Collinsella sp. LCP19S3_A6 TaxID=3438752 RepID=UPI003F90BA77